MPEFRADYGSFERKLWILNRSLGSVKEVLVKNKLACASLNPEFQKSTGRPTSPLYLTSWSETFRLSHGICGHLSFIIQSATLPQQLSKAAFEKKPQRRTSYEVIAPAQITSQNMQYYEYLVVEKR